MRREKEKERERERARDREREREKERVKEQKEKEQRERDKKRRETEAKMVGGISNARMEDAMARTRTQPQPRARSQAKAKEHEESALDTDSGSESGDEQDDDDDDGEMFYDAPAHAHSPPASLSPATGRPPLPPPKSSLRSGVGLGMRSVSGPSSVAADARTSRTTNTDSTRQTVLSGISAFGAPRRDSGSGGGAGDRSSTAANFGTIRTMTTVATSLGDDAYSQRASMLSDGFGGSVLGEPLQGSPRRASIELPGGGPGTAQFLHKQTRDRDRRPSETANIDLSRVIEEGDDAVAAADTGPSGSNGSPPGRKHRPQPIQLGKGKWPDDFLSAFAQQPSPTRAISIKQKHSSDGGISGMSISPPRKLAIVGQHAANNDSSESLGLGLARRPTHRPRHSLDAIPSGSGGGAPSERARREPEPARCRRDRSGD